MDRILALYRLSTNVRSFNTTLPQPIDQKKDLEHQLLAGHLALADLRVHFLSFSKGVLNIK
jgi:hypothetical protein